ncbi:MAG TPA: winged helix-turn-helix domain-containing protein [Amaricoccus sp.]|uniref:winged helix-turn-helix domain-containing protein n=1 Tax=Amaricoccus sp. TaxID=1872485 RepID=UPI002BDA3A63|nr:winged helix-turn-helix domain-containing protein [Amaricoccus sp.]HPG22942.1 winged helix-turn-helix domain-containing protein [Amaricoccus sp.]HRW15300.1 winged helix-turn-helix domain-containing protein [Amaricoccus sp.]
MRHTFGPYILDEDARELSLQGTAVAMQPRVFDLLVHLVRNAGRVVPKDELMDALWPDVIVTEASLQRLVSLARRALEPGGLGTAIRSFVRHGYRFSVDQPALALRDATDAGGADLAAALDCIRRRDWDAACRAFEVADAAGPLAAADIDTWALAVECRGRPAEAIPVLIRAVTAHVAEGQPNLAARDAVTLAKLELERSAPSAAAGWMDRAEALKGNADDQRTDAYFLWMKSRMSSFSGRGEEALQLALAANRAADACGDQGLIALTLTYVGFYNIALGHIDRGVSDQNHAAAIALTSGVDPIFGSTIYCNILWACRTFPDWRRARQWSQGFDTWCQSNYAEVPGTCDLHRAEVLGAQRSLDDALQAIDMALPKLSDEESWSIGDGFRVRGDVKAMIGDLEGARADYAAAYSMGWDAEPGNAMLLAEDGNVPAALLALDRALAGTSWYHLQRRGHLLAHKARIAAIGGQAEVALQALAELDGEAERSRQPAVHALMNETRFHLARAAGSDARNALMLARDLWNSAGLEYQAARVRLELAGEFLSTGDATGAAAEIAAADRIGQRIRSRRLIDRAAALAAALRANEPPATAVGE